MTYPKMNYVVWRVGRAEGDAHKDVRAVVEPSGAVCLYKDDQATGQEYLAKAYPHGTWEDLRQQ